MTDDLTPQGAAAVRLAATVVQLKAERDRARGIAVALEQRLARVEGELLRTASDIEGGVSCAGYTLDDQGCYVSDLAARIRNALGDDQ